MGFFGFHIARDDPGVPKKTWFMKGYEAVRGIGKPLARMARVVMPGVADEITN
jgi:hypothetical protein